MNTVRIFSAPWCAGCKVVKKALSEKGINFKEVDITTTEGSLLTKELGIRNIPVTYVHKLVGSISDEKKFIGSKPETIREILEAVGD